MLINDLPYTPEREREMEREGGRECHLWSMRKSNHLSIKLLANIALRPRYEEISVCSSQEGCQNSPRHTMENCQMIDYRIVSPSRSRSLFFAILFSILCGVLPILVARSLCVRDGLSDDLLVYCQRCSGNPLQKNKTEEGERKRMQGSLITRAEMRHKCPFISLYSRAPLTNTTTTIALATLRCPFHWLLVGASSSSASSPYSHSILAV